MSEQFLICPFDGKLPPGIRRQALVLNVRNPEHVMVAWDVAQQDGNRIHLIRLLVSDTIADMDFPSEWQGIPLAIETPGIGTFRLLIAKLADIRRLNVRFCLSLDRPETCRDAQLLASLGLATSVTFGSQEPDWDALANLMVYALLGPAAHAPVGPFDFFLDHYGQESCLSAASADFNDPSRYLHMNSSGDIAFSDEELLNGCYINGNLENLGDVMEHPDYRLRLTRWRDVFVEMNECTTCSGWSVCMGCVRAITPDKSRCRRFHEELLDTLHQAYGYKREGRRQWQY